MTPEQKAAIELKPCPFCGGDAFAWEADRDDWAVECRSCFNRTSLACTKANAIAAWNKRAVREPSDDEIIDLINLVTDLADADALELAIPEVSAAIKAWQECGEPSEEDWAAEAARLTLEAADDFPPVRSNAGTGIEHAAWMLSEIIAGRITGTKAHRWLGYAQGLLVAGEWLTLDQAKTANKDASDKAFQRRGE